jgi:predicted transcriptional regulator
MTDNNRTSGNSTDRETIEVDESEADFLDEIDPEEYPSVLKLTSKPESQHRRDALDRIERWESGEEVPRVVNFQNPSDLRALLTDRRVELLRSVLTDPPESIRSLAERLDRDVKTVHDDLGVLAEYDIVYFRTEGRAKRPFVPYDTVEVNLELSRPDTSEDAATA